MGDRLVNGWMYDATNHIITLPYYSLDGSYLPDSMMLSKALWFICPIRLIHPGSVGVEQIATFFQKQLHFKIALAWEGMLRVLDDINFMISILLQTGSFDTSLWDKPYFIRVNLMVMWHMQPATILFVYVTLCSLYQAHSVTQWESLVFHCMY